MTKPYVTILRAPGTNCDQETRYAFELAGARAEVFHVNRVLEKPAILNDSQILCVPGGFSYGDDVAAGRILANQMEHHLAEALESFKAAGKLILGICNGFQVLIKSGVIVRPDAELGPPATLTLNESGKYEDRWIWLRTDGAKCVFLAGIESMYLPVAHAEGKFVPRDAATFQQLEAGGQLVLRYASANGIAAGKLAFPENPNGSIGNVAGLCDSTGRVLGLMPHPERHIDVTHHPRWTRGEGREGGHGLQMFINAVRYFA